MERYVDDARAMIDRKALVQQIQSAFAGVEYPGDSNLRNSNEGDEPYLLEKEFKGKDDWRALPVEFIDLAPDGFATALSFFSHAAFRFYLPAYLLADLEGQLLHADPVFYLTHGLTQASKDVLVNPRRFGDMTWFDYAQERFGDFTSQEAEAIVAYLEHQQGKADLDMERVRIEEALENYWRRRADYFAD